MKKNPLNAFELQQWKNLDFNQYAYQNGISLEVNHAGTHRVTSKEKGSLYEGPSEEEALKAYNNAI